MAETILVCSVLVGRFYPAWELPSRHSNWTAAVTPGDHVRCRNDLFPAAAYATDSP